MSQKMYISLIGKTNVFYTNSKIFDLFLLNGHLTFFDFNII